MGAQAIVTGERINVGVFRQPGQAAGRHIDDGALFEPLADPKAVTCGDGVDLGLGTGHDDAGLGVIATLDTVPEVLRHSRAALLRKRLARRQ